LAALQAQHTVPYTLLNGTGMIAVVVPAVIVLFLTRYIVSGIRTGSVK
jgi:ABC-type glycerol-3-phosphate transport system permease component